jgi:hypothetical protein
MAGYQENNERDCKQFSHKAFSFVPCKTEKTYPFHLNMKRLTLKSAFHCGRRPIFGRSETDNCSKNISKMRKKGLLGIQEADYPFQLLG